MLRETHIPALIESDPTSNVTDLIEARVRIAPEHPMFSRRVNGDWQPVSSAAFVRQVRALAAELVEEGIQQGDRVAIVCATSYEWALIEFASYYAGAILVPIYDTNASAQIKNVLSDSGATLVFAESAQHHERVAEACRLLIQDGLSAPRMREIGAIDTATLEQRKLSQNLAAEVERRRAEPELDDVATLVYSSGTTGDAKGSRITHGNFVGLATNIAIPYETVIRSDSSTLLFLPLAHVLARSVQLVAMHAGMTVGHLPGPADLLPEMTRFRPTFLMVVPRLLEKVEVAVTKKASSGIMGPVFRAARRCAIQVATVREAHPGRALPFGLRLRHAIADRLIFTKVRALFGGQLDALLSGASALAADTARFFSGAGLPIIEGYGLTETTAPITGNPVGAARFGSVGIPVPGATVRIADDGEILVSGPGVIESYWRETLNEGAFVDGFFRTGDQGRLDNDGYLSVTGRAKDLIVTSYGKNIAPEPMEQAIALQSSLVAQAIVVGEARPYLSAFVAIDRETVAGWAVEQQLDLTDRVLSEIPELVTEIDAAIERANSAVSNPEQVKQFRIIEEEFTVENGALTPTQKLKRAYVMKDLSPRINAIYA